MADLDLGAIRERIERAHTLVGALALHGQGQWRMRIPADPERDSDLILSAALSDAEVLLAEVDRLAPVVEAALAWRRAVADASAINLDPYYEALQQAGAVLMAAVDALEEVPDAV